MESRKDMAADVKTRLETLTPPLSALYASWKIDEIHAFLHLVPRDALDT